MIVELRSLDECRGVVAIQHAVWGQDGETVPASILGVSAKRGGILLGAIHEGRLVGFVWSMPGLRDGRPTQWSHMLGVLPDARRRGAAAELKLAQRDRALRSGVDLIEWTFDPLQAANAHFNLARLGGVASEYRRNAYGELAGPLHRGTPTDRLIVEWWIARPHVIRRIETRPSEGRDVVPIVARDAGVLEAPVVISTRQGAWLEPISTRTDLPDRRVLIPVPPRFHEMQQQAPEAALAWRLATRSAFETYLARGYRTVDFFKDDDQGGSYLLVTEQAT